MQTIKSLSASAVLLLGVNFSLTAQGKLPDGSQAMMLDMTSHIADVDSSLQVETYSLGQRRALFKQLYQADQRYRDSLQNGSRSEINQQLFSHRMVANDLANQALLAKIVRRFGWPTSKQYGDQAPLTAWLIVWHASLVYQSRYYPMIKQAYQGGLIQQNPIELAQRLKRYSR